MPPRTLSVTNVLIGICVAVFLIGLCLKHVPALYAIPCPTELVPPQDYKDLPHIYGAYSYFYALQLGEWWRFLTYQFVHADTGHLLFNMWALYFFGPAVERVFGPGKFLLFYLVCGVAGAVFSTVLAAWGVFGTVANTPLGEVICSYLAHLAGYEGSVSPWQLVPMVGASASIYGVLIATAFLYPDVRIQLLFPPVTLKLRTFALGVIGFAVVAIYFGFTNAGGEAGHLGGVLMGTLIMLVYKLSRRRAF